MYITAGAGRHQKAGATIRRQFGLRALSLWGRAQDGVQDDRDHYWQKAVGGEVEKIADEQNIGIWVAVDETEVRRRVKSAGGTWNGVRRVWELGYKKVKELGSVERMVRDEANNL